MGGRCLVGGLFEQVGISMLLVREVTCDGSGWGGIHCPLVGLAEGHSTVAVLAASRRQQGK